MLTNCNQLSINRLKTAGTEFKKHTALLIEMKRDLDYIFKKIRLVKNKLSQQYPQAFNGNYLYGRDGGFNAKPKVKLLLSVNMQRR